MKRKGILGSPCYRVAVKELRPSYYSKGTLVLTTYPDYGNLVYVPYRQPALKA